MSVSFRREDGTILRMNAWSWGVLHEVIFALEVIPEGQWEPARTGSCRLEAEQVTALVDALDREVVPCFEPGVRMLVDGTFTEEPDDGTFYRDESEMWRNYSLHHDVLIEAVEFLRASDGFVVIE